MGVRDSATRTYGINYIHPKVSPARCATNKNMPLSTHFVSCRTRSIARYPE